jgi:hypothetical protein
MLVIVKCGVLFEVQTESLIKYYSDELRLQRAKLGMNSILPKVTSHSYL